MIKDLIEKVKERELSLGALMVLIGVLVWIIPVKLVLTLFVIYGLVLIFWKKKILNTILIIRLLFKLNNVIS